MPLELMCLRGRFTHRTVADMGKRNENSLKSRKVRSLALNHEYYVTAAMPRTFHTERSWPFARIEFRGCRLVDRYISSNFMPKSRPTGHSTSISLLSRCFAMICIVVVGGIAALVSKKLSVGWNGCGCRSSTGVKYGLGEIFGKGLVGYRCRYCFL
jgi:hypothetical protein